MCVRSTPITTTTSTVTLFSTLFHSAHFNSSLCCGLSLLHIRVRRSPPTNTSVSSVEQEMVRALGAEAA